MEQADNLNNYAGGAYEHQGVSRRDFLRLSAGALAAVGMARVLGAEQSAYAAEQLPMVEVEPGLSIVQREGWAEEMPADTERLEAEEVKFLMLKHTAGSNEYSKEDVPGIIQDMYADHTTGENDWPDIAHNFLVDRFGTVYEGREGSIEGPVRTDSSGGSQGYTQTVAMIGNFDTQMPTVEARQSMVKVLAWLAKGNGLDLSDGSTATFESRGSSKYPAGQEVTTPVITAHSSMNHTTSPGTVLGAAVESGAVLLAVRDYRSQVDAYIAGQPKEQPKSEPTEQPPVQEQAPSEPNEPDKDITAVPDEGLRMKFARFILEHSSKEDLEKIIIGSGISTVASLAWLRKSYKDD